MNSVYESLFELAFENNYYSSGKAKNLQVILSTESKKVLKNYQLLFKAIEGGSLILYNKNSFLFKDTNLWQGKEIKLSFLIINNNSNFFNFTKLPQTTSFQYYSNLYLKSKDSEEIFESFFLKIKAPHFNYNLEFEEQNKKYEIINNLDQVVLEGQTAKKNALTIDLSGEPLGRYRLKIEEKEKLDFYTYANIQQPFLGVIEIYLNSLKETPKYFLKFERRSTFWQYIIRYPKSKDWQFEIRQKKGTVPISFCSEKSEEEDQKLIIFNSCSPIPFTELAEYAFELKIIPEGGSFLELIMKIDLPNPDVQILGPLIENPCGSNDKAGKEHLSRIYVYL